MGSCVRNGAHIHASFCARKLACTRAHTHANANICRHTCTHARIHTQRTRTNAYTHTHAPGHVQRLCVRMPACSLSCLMCVRPFPNCGTCAGKSGVGRSSTGSAKGGPRTKPVSASVNSVHRKGQVRQQTEAKSSLPQKAAAGRARTGGGGACLSSMDVCTWGWRVWCLRLRIARACPCAACTGAAHMRTRAVHMRPLWC